MFVVSLYMASEVSNLKTNSAQGANYGSISFSHMLASFWRFICNGVHFTGWEWGYAARWGPAFLGKSHPRDIPGEITSPPPDIPGETTFWTNSRGSF